MAAPEPADAAHRPELRFDAGTLSLHRAGSAGHQGSPGKPPFSAPWIFDPRNGVWRADARHYSAMRGQPDNLFGLSAAPLPFDDRLPRWSRVEWPRRMALRLREDQREAVRAWQRSEGRGVVVMPTGSGKTVVALAIMEQTAASTLIVAPVRDLMYQWHRRIRDDLGYDAGVVGDGSYEVRPVTVTTYESACLHMAKLGDRFELIVFDECHHLPGPVRGDAGRMSAAPLRLGLTATPLEPTPGREGGEGVRELIGPVCYHLGLSAARGTILADYQVLRIPVHLDPAEQARYDDLGQQIRSFLRERRQQNPAYDWQQLCREATRVPAARRVFLARLARTAVEDRAQEKLRILEDIFRLHGRDPVIVFTGSNRMAHTVSETFLIPALLHHCKKEERAEILDGFACGIYPAVVANQVLDEGVDIPAAKVGVVLGGSGSTRQAQQRLGRILRRSGSLSATLYEVVCADTGEAGRSRQRRHSDAYQGTRHHRM